MTCIAVKVNKKKIEIAGDTQTTWGTNKYPKANYVDKQLKAEGKIFQVNGMTIGCAGSVPDIGLLQLFSKTHKPKEMERDDILAWLIEFKEWAIAKTKLGFNDISIHGILICDGKVWAFYDYMDAIPVLDFESVGSGMWLAIGAMELGASAEVAVRTAIKYDLFCGGDVTKLIIDL